MAKKTVKHDPKQMFVVSTVSRWDIANMLNEHIGMSVDMFHEDDPRLTDKVCQKIADLMYDAEAQVDEVESADQTAVETFVQSMPKRLFKRPRA